MDLKDDGSFRMDMSYFAYCYKDVMTSAKMDRLFGGPPRSAESEIGQREMDIAASIQAVTEEIVLQHRPLRPHLDRLEESDLGRRRRAQLRRQWTHPARRPV